MRRSATALVVSVMTVCAASALAASGCGGAGGESAGGTTTLSAAEFRTQADAICSDFFAQMEALGQEPTTAEAYLDYAKKALPVLEEGHRRLHQLVPPDDLAERWNQGLTVNDEIDQNFRDLLDALEEGDLATAQNLAKQIQTENDESGRLAREVGLTVCG
jgi:hypothetical protein